MAYLKVNISSPVPVYRQIMDQIRRLVSEEEIAPGEPLPSVRQLAAELAVNPNTVAKAYQLLEFEGTLVTLKRRGAYVGRASSAQAGLARKRRIAEAVDRLIEEAGRLGATKEEIARALAERTQSMEPHEALGEPGVPGSGGGPPGGGRRLAGGSDGEVEG